MIYHGKEEEENVVRLTIQEGFLVPCVCSSLTGVRVVSLDVLILVRSILLRLFVERCEVFRIVCRFGLVWEIFNRLQLFGRLRIHRFTCSFGPSHPEHDFTANCGLVEESSRPSILGQGRIFFFQVGRAVENQAKLAHWLNTSILRIYSGLQSFPLTEYFLSC